MHSMRVVRLFGTVAWRALAIIASLGIFLVAGRVLLGGTEVRAAMDTYYPQFCLGGWEHPRAASGEPETSAGDSADAFTSGNAAFLAPDVSAQIFCGYFPVEEREHPPVSARIRLVWHLDGAAADAVSGSLPQPAPAPAPAAATEDATNSDETDVPAQEALPDTATTPAPANDTEHPGSPAADTAPSVPATPPETPAAQETPAPATQGDTPAPSAAPDTAPPSAPAADSPTSFLSGASHVAAAWIRAHTPLAYAQSSSAESMALSLSDWFEVSYSLDGVRWHSIGRVNATNWRDFTVSVPLSSWQDLRDVQIMVAALPSLTDRPSAYLDGMELRVETDPTLAESASAAVGAAGDLLDSAVDAVLSLLPGRDEPTSPEFASAPVAPEPAPAPKAKKRVLQFTVRGTPLPTSSRLPWQTEDAQDEIASTTLTVIPDIARSDDGRSFIVSGSCSSAYAVVIAYPEADDYREHPRNALVNVATPCESGHYTFNLGLLPDSTRSGTLYLLIGAQGETGTWTPASALIPITIDPIEIEQ